MAGLALLLPLVVAPLLAGPALLERLRTGEPDPSLRVRLAGIKLSWGLLRRSDGEPETRDAVEAGARAGGGILLAGSAERKGEPDRAKLWLALDAHGRGQLSLAELYMRDLRGSGQPPADWEAWKTWAAAPEGKASEILNRGRDLTELAPAGRAH